MTPKRIQVTRQRTHGHGAEARREAELREAHQVAFDKIRAARSDADYQVLVAHAVEELIDACELYIARNS